MNPFDKVPKDKTNLQLLIPINLLLPVARYIRKERLHFKRVQKGHWQIVRHLYSKAELAVFRSLNPNFQQVEMTVYEDVVILVHPSDSMIIIDKDKARAEFEVYMEKQRKEQLDKMFESLRPTNYDYRDSLIWSWNKRWGIGSNHE